MDSFTTMAGDRRVTEKIKLIGSVGLQAHHPAVAARHAAMIQMISNGRFWLNIVTGWQKSEYESLGLWRGDEHYESRYDYADEYITICQELWETGESASRASTSRSTRRCWIRAAEPIRSFAPARRSAACASPPSTATTTSSSARDVRRSARNEQADPRGRREGRPEIKSIASIHCIMGDTDRRPRRRSSATTTAPTSRRWPT